MRAWLQYLMFIFITIFMLTTSFAHEIKLKPISTKTAIQLYNPVGNTVAGNPNGKITLVEFFDYNCHYCRSLQPAIQELINKNSDLRVVYKEYLLFGEPSRAAISAALAANNQGKYLTMLNALLNANRPLEKQEVLRIAKKMGLDTQRLAADIARPIIQKQIEDNLALAETLEIQAAPAFIIANSDIATNSKKTNTPQYLYIGSDGAQGNLQMLINKIRIDQG